MFIEKGKETELLRAIQDGQAILLLGAGFNCDIENRPNHKIPAAYDLTEALKSHFGISGNAQLDEVYNALKAKDAKVVSDFLMEELCVKQFSDIPASYHPLLRAPWKRIYTLNFDNILSLLQENLSPLDKIKVYKKGGPTLIAEDERIIYLNGKLPAKDLRDLTITRADYAGRSDEFIQCFTREFLQYPVVIVGCQLRETHFDWAIQKYYDENNPPRTKPGYFINKFSETVTDQSWYRDHGIETINSGTAEFLNWLNRHFPDPLSISLKEKHDYRKSQMMAIDGEEDLDEISKDTSIMENPLDGKFSSPGKRTTWNEISQSVVTTHEFFNFDDDNSFYFISGKQGSGKSTFLLNNISNFIRRPNRWVIFAHPGRIKRTLPGLLAEWLNLENQEEDTDLSEVLIVIDALKREKESLSTLKERMRLVIEIAAATGAKFLISIRDNEFDYIKNEINEGLQYNYSEIRLENYGNNILNDIIDKYFSYYEIERPHDYGQVRSLIREKARQSPAYIRTLFNHFIKQEIAFTQDELSRIPAGSSNLTYYRLGLFYQNEAGDSINNWINFLVNYLKNHPQGLTKESIYLIARSISQFRNEKWIDDFTDTVLSVQTWSYAAGFEKYYLDSHTLADIEAGIEGITSLDSGNLKIKDSISKYRERKYHEDYALLEKNFNRSLTDGIQSLSSIAFAVDFLDLKASEDYGPESFKPTVEILETLNLSYRNANAELKKEPAYLQFNENLYFHWRALIKREEEIYRGRVEEVNRNIYYAWSKVLEKDNGAGENKDFAKLDFAVFLRKKMIPFDPGNFRVYDKQIRNLYDSILLFGSEAEALQYAYVDYARYLMNYELLNPLIEQLLERAIKSNPDNSSSYSVYGNYFLSRAQNVPEKEVAVIRDFIEKGKEKYHQGFSLFEPNTIDTIIAKVKREETIYRNAYASFLSDCRFFTTNNEEDYDKLLEDIYEQYLLLEENKSLHKQSLNSFAVFLMKEGFRLKQFRNDQEGPLLKAQKILRERIAFTKKTFGNGEPETLQNLAILYLRFFKRKDLQTYETKNEAEKCLLETIASKHPIRGQIARLELSSLYLTIAIEEELPASKEKRLKDAFAMLSDIIHTHKQKLLVFQWDFTIRAYVLLSVISQMRENYGLKIDNVESFESYLNEAVKLAKSNNENDQSLRKAFSYLLQDFSDLDPQLMLNYLIEAKRSFPLEIKHLNRYADNCFTNFFIGKGRLNNLEENKFKLLDLAQKWFENYPSIKSIQNFAHYAINTNRPNLLIAESRYAKAREIFEESLKQLGSGMDYYIISTLRYYSIALSKTDYKSEANQLNMLVRMIMMFFTEYKLSFLQEVQTSEEGIQAWIDRGRISYAGIAGLLIYLLNDGKLSEELRRKLVADIFPSGKYMAQSPKMPSIIGLLADELKVEHSTNKLPSPYQMVLGLCKSKRRDLDDYFQDKKTDKANTKEVLLFSLRHYYQQNNHENATVILDAIEYLQLRFGIFSKMEKRIWAVIKDRITKNFLSNVRVEISPLSNNGC